MIMAEVLRTHGNAPGGAIDTVWYTRCPVPTASSIAIELGWLDAAFAPDRIHIASLRESADRAVRESHFDHTQRNSFREGGSAPPIWSRARGQDVRLIGATWVDQYQAVVALPQSGIRSAADLRGRRLGVAQRLHDRMDFWRAKSLRGLLTALAVAGLGERDAEIVLLPEEATFLGDEAPSHTGTLWSAKQHQNLQRAEAFALIRGEVDAIYLSGARGAVLEAFLGAERVVDLGAHPDRAVRITNATPTLLTVSGELVREHPALVRRYLACLRRAAAWAAEHRGEARRIIAGDVSEAEEWIDVAFGEAVYTSLEPTLSDELLAAVESQKAFLWERGFLPADFDVRAWAAPELLAEAYAR
jgi:ABC-type nitrate/sulfonate/bicarbonate transport system substrate-binding protein